VITIILLVSAVALPTVLPALSHRQVSEAARILQSVLAGARDAAIRDNAPSGIRLVPDAVFNGIGPPTLADGVTPNPFAGRLDPTQPIAYSRIVPIEQMPEYNEGLLSFGTSALAGNFSSTTPITYPVNNFDGTTGLYPFAGLDAATVTTGSVLMVYEQIYNISGFYNSPTSWFWNIRVGDKIQINNSGPWYTVVGPLAIPANGTTWTDGNFYANPELFVNVGPPGSTSPLQVSQGSPTNQVTVNPDFLFLVNGQDDNNNGWVDEGWDGVDNDNNGIVDDLAEWEIESWLGADRAGNIFNVAYTIQRRPAPTINAREVSLPSNVVIDATTILAGTSVAKLTAGTRERSRIPLSALNQMSGYIEILIAPDGSIIPTTLYSSPSSITLGDNFYHFWFAERTDVFAPTVNTLTATGPAPAPYGPFLPITQGIAPGLFAANAELKGENRIVTLFARTGQVTTNENVVFDLAAKLGTQNYNPAVPFIQAQQGVSGGQQ
jgi:hypothetical protein